MAERIFSVTPIGLPLPDTDRFPNSRDPKLPSVAICIPTYNQADYLSFAVRSAFAQTYPGVEVWVSDDRSTDHTPEVLQELQKEFPALKSHRHAENRGISGNNNWLLAQPETDYIVRLDSDDALEPDYVQTLLPIMEAEPNAAYAHCAIQEIDREGQPRRIRSLAGRGQVQSAEDSLRASISGYRVAANILMFRTAALRAMHYYRPQLGFAEDWDLAVRFADHGYSNLYSDHVLARYRWWDDAGRTRSKRKIVEIEGVLHVFEDSLIPAFEKRGWDTEGIWDRRRAMALNHALVIDAPQFTAEERARIVALLERLGPSPALKLQTWFMLKLHMGAVFRARKRMNSAARDVAKSLVRGIARRSPA
jgi:glycosyltransferase involved in cell wall biosynthesis